MRKNEVKLPDEIDAVVFFYNISKMWVQADMPDDDFYRIMDQYTSQLEIYSIVKTKIDEKNKGIKQLYDDINKIRIKEGLKPFKNTSKF